MKPLYQYFFIAALLLLIACNHRYYRTNNAYAISTVNNNVCKKLNGKVFLYAIFVDARQTKPWTGYDISTTLDSIRKATAWITEKAAHHNIPLSIEMAYHIKDPY